MEITCSEISTENRSAICIDYRLRGRSVMLAALSTTGRTMLCGRRAACRGLGVVWEASKGRGGTAASPRESAATGAPTAGKTRGRGLP